MPQLETENWRKRYLQAGEGACISAEIAHSFHACWWSIDPPSPRLVRAKSARPLSPLARSAAKIFTENILMKFGEIILEK